MLLKSFVMASVLIGSVLLSGCGGAPPAADTGQAVAMKDIQFAPASLTVAKGTKVTWTNKDVTVHTVTSDETGGPLQSGNVAAGGKYSYTFSVAGTFKYHCTPHASKGSDGNYTGMAATITVTG
ncbi:MAG TPA: plastocyanin/azurin family copper-binding protein [Candidatus Thermoplasmatota archaeon]|nr:plastocyanin/azurin family copper-binding protein [Candidatus Thermoplasmatota archaeon]